MTAVVVVERIGSCRIVREIASGGMAIVYEAVQEPLGRRVAVKKLRASLMDDFEFEERFRREARYMAVLQHENILHVIDFLNYNEELYIVMEYVDGIDLFDVLKAAGQLPPEIAAIIALGVARALDHIHFRGLIHRDVKPANIIVSKQGEVKLTDFGIAREVDFSDLTEVGMGVGTPSYMSPEQASGDPIDYRSDMFSLGVVLYQMLTGQKPFLEDSQRNVLLKIAQDEPTPPKKLGVRVPRRLQKILDRSLQKNPDDRYPSFQALVNELSEFVAGRVAINHQARLMLFLRDTGQIEAGDAERTLQRVSLVGGSHHDKKQIGKKQLVASQALAGILLVTGFAAMQLPRDTYEKAFNKTGRWFGFGALPVGYLQVNAIPWADVYIDGEKLLTTPSAQPIALSEGRHSIKFVNPFAKDIMHDVTIQGQRTTQITATFKELSNNATKRTDK